MRDLAASERLVLHGLTILAVEDSRFASEALRLLCQRAGARLRRAENLAAARAHLRVYRPDVAIVDLGLPDGRGERMIRDLVLARPRPALVLGTSGNPNGRQTALAAGADGFLDKPIESLAGFCTTLLALLPDLSGAQHNHVGGMIKPDRLALHDDLCHAAQLLAEARDPPAQRYVAGFVYGFARQGYDSALAGIAARAMQQHAGPAIEELRDQLALRLKTRPTGFRPE